MAGFVSRLFHFLDHHADFLPGRANEIQINQVFDLFNHRFDRRSPATDATRLNDLAANSRELLTRVEQTLNLTETPSTNFALAHEFSNMFLDGGQLFPSAAGFASRDLGQTVQTSN